MEPETTISRQNGSPQPRPPPPPPQVDDMVFHKFVGRGGFGEVWLAEDAGRRRCAVKVLLPGTAQLEQNAYRAYKNICDADADGLVPIGNMFKTRDGRYWYTLELADDLNAHNQDPQRYEPCTLQAYLARQDDGRLHVDEALAIIEAVLRALDRLHRKGLVHCDIKPLNILRIGGQWCLGDTGALLHVDDLPAKTSSPRYTPPEGIAQQRDELYSVGKTLYALLAGSAETYPTPTFLRQGSLDGRTRRALAGANELILRACHRNQSARYDSAEQMLQDVRAVKAARRQRRAVLPAERTA